MDVRGRGVFQNEVLIISLLLLFSVGTLYVVNGYRNNASLLEEFYAAELARQIDLAEPGTVLEFDVTSALVVAERSQKDPYSLFSINSEGNRVIVSLREGGGHSFSFFRDVEVVNEGVSLPGNVLRLRVL